MTYLESLRAQAAAIDEARSAFLARMNIIAGVIDADTTRSAATPEEDAEFRQLEAWAAVTTDETELRARIVEVEAIETRAAAASQHPFTAPNVNGGSSHDDPYDIDLRSAPRTPEVLRDIRERALRAVEQADMTDEHRTVVDARLRDSKVNRNGALSRHLIVTGSDAYRSAFSKLTTQAQPFLTQDEARAVEEARALQITTDGSGGFLMPFTLDPTVILNNNGTINPIRDLATVKTVATDNWQGITSTGVTAAYGAESAVVADGTPALLQPTVLVKKAHAFVPFTMEAEDDLAGLSTDVATMFNDAKMRLEATKFTLGVVGSNEPNGIVTALVAASKTVASAGADAYAVADVYALTEAVPARYRSNGKWMAALSTINLTRKFGTALGHAFLTDLGGGQPPQILGQSLYENSEMDGVINAAAENYMVIYGDFSAYRIHDRIGLSIELVPFLFDQATARPTGERGWYARWRNGANLVDTNALRVLNVT